MNSTTRRAWAAVPVAGLAFAATACTALSGPLPRDQAAPSSSVPTGTVTRTVTATSAPRPTSAPRKTPTSKANRATDDLPDCQATNVAAVIEPGEALGHGVFEATIVLTNHGSGPCAIYGSSAVKLFTGNGAPLGIKTVRSTGDAPKLITVRIGGKATMRLRYPAPYLDDPTTDCLPRAESAGLVLPGDSEQVDAKPRDPRYGLPEVCGPVTVTPWS